MTLGLKIRQYRAEHDLTLEEFGKRVGATRAYISQIERGGMGKGKTPRISLNKLVMIAEALGTTLSDLAMEVDDIDNATSLGTVPEISKEDEFMIVSRNRTSDSQQYEAADKNAALGSMMTFLNSLTAEQINKLHHVGEIIF